MVGDGFFRQDVRGGEFETNKKYKLNETPFQSVRHCFNPKLHKYHNIRFQNVGFCKAFERYVAVLTNSWYQYVFIAKNMTSAVCLRAAKYSLIS